MFLILEGEGTLRYATKTYKIKKHDIIACPAGGKEEAHQILNTSDNDLKYLCLSTNLPYDICEYPDSNKIMCKASSGKEISVRKIFKQEDNVDYMVREE